MPPRGKVYLVGAGPGEPGLITVRGRELLVRADCVIYDSLVDESLLAHAEGAEHIFAGKRAGLHSLEQEDINRLLVEQARGGARVVRLKGGDPFVFGRGGEELLALSEAGIAFEVVPGVSTAFSAGAFAGIPATHRGVSSRVTILSAHDIDAWDLSGGEREGTVVVFMGARRIGRIAATLVRFGWDDDVSCAAVSNASRPGQHTVVASLGKLSEACEREGLESPAMIVVGDVVGLRERLSWFERRPLHGKRVAVTRTRKGAGELVEGLHEQGAEVMVFETVQFESPSPTTIDPERFDWIVFASPNSVTSLVELLGQAGKDARALHRARFLTVGAKTRQALVAQGLRPDVESESYDAEHVRECLIREVPDMAEQQVLMPRADIARGTIANALRTTGAIVTELSSYRAAIPTDSSAAAEKLLDFDPHYVTFMGTAAPKNFARILGAERLARLSATAVYAVIGESTAEAARAAGTAPAIIPESSTTSALVDRLVQYEVGRQ